MIIDSGNKQFGAIPLSPNSLEKMNIGMWAFEFDEGKEPRMYADEAMLKLIGLTKQVSPEQTYRAWYDNIDKNSYAAVADAVEKMVSGEYAEVQYPWHHPDGKTRVVRCDGVRNPDYTIGVRLEGTHHNISEDVGDDMQLAGKKILLVEDNDLIRDIQADILSDGGYVVDTCEDGGGAIEKVAENGTAYYDFILMDIQMPVMNGYEATAEIRKLPGGGDAVVIALSANAFREDMDRSYNSRINAHVTKPLDLEALNATLKQFVNKKG